MTKTLRKNSDFFSINTNCTGKKYFSKNNFIAQTAQEGAKRISRHESFFQWKMTKTLRKNSDFFQSMQTVPEKNIFRKIG